MRTPDEVLKRLRKYSLSLPESSEVQSWGHPNFRAGRKTFAVFEYYKGIPSIAIRIDSVEKASLLSDARFYRTPYGGNRGWISIRLDRRLSWDRIQDLVLKSYRMVALKRMIKLLEID
jgi:predicted DNA-binding protein (MmcQ/YjbR family)